MSEAGYKNILKTTFLFGFVQIVSILSKVILNKLIATFIGPEGIGLVGLYNNIINVIKTGAGLGISQSAVKDISESNHTENLSKKTETIFVVNHLIIGTSLIGLILTVILSPLISIYVFNNLNFILPICLLSLAVGFSVYNEGQMAILKGLRQLRYLANVGVLTSFFSLIIGAPIYYLFGLDGIVYALILSSLVAVLINSFFLRKNTTLALKKRFSFKEIVNKGKPMIKMGASLMIVSLLVFLSDFIIAAYINKNGGTTMFGIFQAGVTIVSSYFGIILTAITTDYYPRISAINQDNIKLTQEVNSQSEVSLMLAFPLIVFFLFFSPELIKVLYSKDFLTVINYTDFAVMGMLIIICSNNMGMILLAKQSSKIFLVTSVSQRAVTVLISLFLYKKLGIQGLGITYLLMSIIHFFLMTIIMKKFYNIVWERKILIKILIIFILVTTLPYFRDQQNLFIKYGLGIITTLISLFVSIVYIKKKTKFKFLKKNK